MANVKKNFLYQSLFQVLSMVLPLVTSPILSRSLGAEGVGIFVYVSTIENYFVLVANLGIYKYGTREIAKVKADADVRSRTFWAIWRFHLIIITIVGIAYLFCTFFIFEYKTYFLIYFLAYIGSTITLDWLFAGVEDFKKIVIRDCVVKLISFLLILIFVHDKDNLIHYFILSALCFFFSSFFYWILYKQYINKKTKVEIDYKKLFHGMLILFVPVLLDTLYHSMDKLMLGLMCEKSQVGYYGNAEKALIAKKLVYSITIVLLPTMSSLLAKGEKEKFSNMMKKSIGLICLLSAAFSFGTAGIAHEFSIIFWGSDFEVSGDLIVVMSLAMPAVLLSAAIREQYLVASGNEKKYLLSSGLGAVVNLIINFILIPIYGAMGASVATLVSEYVVLISQIIVVRKDIPIKEYLRGNYIYIMFGLVMFMCIRVVASAFTTSIPLLLIEILCGAIVYTLFCIIYWKVSKNYYYLSLLSQYLGKVKMIFRRKEK